jgi:hypothetical protein
LIRGFVGIFAKRAFTRRITQWKVISFLLRGLDSECFFIRITQTGTNWPRGTNLSLCAFEVFGTLIE